ncbi:MAG: hypothetical protein CO158_03980 [Piscirickettsiaceae bacterium CG_4_9_14_3_um_filter_43_564]|nr:hypothetical protein [Thiomicrospira sp.]OIP94450.1 MAG: hypothetical protein AUK56_08960 [Thiomicrospira sp. CG2_30_44_34]PIQ03966.1 MAG: hypothetical protein COW74_05985 [Piscirickettsiaceae bacterium CG18_big_fil_WC_8_21_14_2_50_44_103]PIU38445.1 MAG: hypothetical protein COT01_06605 [Piscirickettsiaceae bacterium CG07_land_8_20_14_0_80_44_28]PIW58338.1 MAG: hypothetical protein COW14_01710 [Piscirickettsiaceae bacterium CG12_big_fil_rev_8_21_14_0_65_44_934]PIW78571.1 MAG: hypothetical p
MASHHPQDPIEEKEALIKQLDQLLQRYSSHQQGSSVLLSELQIKQLADKIKKILKSQLN